MFELFDTFNNRVVSRHRSLLAAVVANDKLQRKVAQANGPTFFLPCNIRRQDGKPVWPEDLDKAEFQFYCR